MYMCYRNKMFWSLISFATITCMLKPCTASDAFDRTIAYAVGCKIDVHWSSSHYFQFQVLIQKKYDAKFSFNLDTTAHSFTYNEAEPAQTYMITWIPIGEKRIPVYELQKNKSVTIRKDCSIRPSLSTKKVSVSEHDCLSTSTTLPSTHGESTQPDPRDVKRTFSNPVYMSPSTTVPSTHLESSPSSPRNTNSTFSLPDSRNEPFSREFCRIYFWTSLCSIPVIVCIVSAIFYLCVLRKIRGTIQDDNVSTQQRSNANVKSTFYANDGPNEYDEVQYCLAQYTEK